MVVTLLLAVASGCGTIRENRATEQLLLSDAVDRSVANIDFSPLSGEKVYLDTRFLQIKNDSAVTTNYVISALRQQMVVAGCLLQDSMEEATYVAEARLGTLGADGHEINYGVPASNALNAAATLVSNSPPLPALPEVSLGKRTAAMAAAKIAVFAYDRETRYPAWQSGTSLARSKATGTWVLGAGPFQRGSIYNGTQFAGERPIRPKPDKSNLSEPDIAFRKTDTWDPKLRKKVHSGEHFSLPQIELPGEATETVAGTSDDQAR